MLESLTNYLYPRSPIEEEQEHIKKLQVVPSLPPPAKVDLPLKQLDYQVPLESLPQKEFLNSALNSPFLELFAAIPSLASSIVKWKLRN